MISIIKSALSIYGLAYVVVNTHGPFDIFKRFKQMLGVMYTDVLDGYGNTVDVEEESDGSSLADMVLCFYCFSFWVTVFYELLTKRQFKPLELLQTYGLVVLMNRIAR